MEFEKEVKFKIFQYNKNKQKRFKEIILKLNAIKNINCTGCGCFIIYNNGRKKLIYWDSKDTLEQFEFDICNNDYDDFISTIWFEDETYNIFWKWKNYWFDLETGEKNFKELEKM